MPQTINQPRKIDSGWDRDKYGPKLDPHSQVDMNIVHQAVLLWEVMIQGEWEGWITPIDLQQHDCLTVWGSYDQ